MQQQFKRILPKLIGTTYNATALFHPRLAANWAFLTFCRIRNGSVRPEQVDFLKSAKQLKRKIVNLDIQEYQWEGSGDTVILVHGWESNAARWRNLISMLVEADFNIIAFDAPGHGRSGGKFLNVVLYGACLEALLQIHKPAHLVGHSVGGMTILFNEFERPNPNVKRIVTTGAPSEFYEIMEEYKAVLGLNDRMMRAFDRLVLEKFGYSIREFSTTTFAAHNKKNGLLIHDKQDRVAPYHGSVNVHKAWKGSRLISTEGYGHSLHQEDVNLAIVDFLKDSN